MYIIIIDEQNVYLMYIIDEAECIFIMYVINERAECIFFINIHAEECFRSVYFFLYLFSSIGNIHKFIF